jgi:hypothetical protein
MVVPVPLSPNEESQLWNYQVWLSPGGQSRILLRDFMIQVDGRPMHCILHLDQSEAPDFRDNNMLCTEGCFWHGNVLVVWANNDWPPHLVLDVQLLLDVLLRP